MGEVEIIKEEKIKLWNKNFFLLWQGQLVSVLGDVLYSIALGFWVYERTKSTAIMGTLEAVTMLPRVILGPFAGVFVDKWDRKKDYSYNRFDKRYICNICWNSSTYGIYTSLDGVCSWCN